MDAKLAELYEQEGKELPSSQAHGSDDDIRQKMVKLLPNSWHMSGNQLIGQTEMGRLVQHLPTNYICTGTDEKGLPILKKIA